MDDVLDYESASATLGKPGSADLNLGFATGPALYAWEEHPEMGELIQGKFEWLGDVELVRYSIILCLGLFNLPFYISTRRPEIMFYVHQVSSVGTSIR